MASWEETIQGWGSKVIDGWTESTYRAPTEIRKMELEQLGALGTYTEGQPLVNVRPTPGFAIGGGTMLLIGAAVLAFVMLRD